MIVVGGVLFVYQHHVLTLHVYLFLFAQWWNLLLLAFFVLLASSVWV